METENKNNKNKYVFIKKQTTKLNKSIDKSKWLFLQLN